MGFLIPAVKAVAAVVAKSAIAKTVVKLAATAIISKVATKAISKLIAKRDGAQGPGGSDAGGRVQLPPATDNKLPIVYGSAWVGGPVIDAKISTDQKYMWYCIALSEKPDNTTVQFDVTNGVYYGGKLVSYGTNGAVASLITNSTPAQTDTKVANKIYIWLFQNGAANAGINTGGQTAIQIMSDSVTGGGIPASERWNSTLYTDGGQSVKLDDVVFAIVRVEYNTDAGTTGLDTLQIKVTNNMGSANGCQPGTAILDYMTNGRYGCDIPLENIDVTSLTNLNTYSNQFIQYVDVNNVTQTQPYRYRVNGPLDTGNPCLTNLQFLADTCDSWIQYTETTGKWRIVPNRPYTGSLTSLYHINDSVLIGGIQINPIDLNDTYNQVEVAYPNTNVKDQTDYQIVDLTDPTTAWYPIYNSVLSPNEAINRLNITLPLVNQAVQAKYLAVRRLLQSREDLVISCLLDYSGIQIDAGDVVRVTHNAYGWTNKLFRVSSVSEVQDEQGNLSAQIEAFEYNGAIYDDNAIQDFIPSDNTGLSDPNIISPPCPPTVTNLNDQEATITGFLVETCVPDTGTVLYMDFNYGNTSNSQTHQLYRTIQSAGGIPFTNSDSANGYYNTINITVNDLPAANYFWSATARNDTAGRYSDSSPAYNWGGANVQPFNPDTGRGGISGGQVKANTISGNNIAPGAISLTKLANTMMTTEFANGYFYTTSNPVANTVNTPVDITTLGNISTGNWDTPKYLNIAYSGSLSDYPLYIGDASTTEGYVANSTAAFTPGEAAQFDIVNGDYDWWVLENSELAIPTGLASYMVYTSQFVSNVDCTIQLVPFLSLQANVASVNTQLLDTIDLSANRPYYHSKQYQLSAANAITHNGILIRSLTANANIIAVRTRFLLSKGYAQT